ncbi:MAG: PKD domain-containing protein [Bacteroidales bacterium]
MVRQVGWQKVSYPVTAGNHTFKWEYEKDFSISTGSDCAWIDYIELPNTVMQAHFGADNTEPCVEDEVQFTDFSSGQPSSWQWTFESGSPASSTEQNPIVLYSIVGSYDVTLTVSDGYYNNTLTLSDYITVNSLPEVTMEPFDWVCLDWPAFELTGGMPADGVYSGPGVENGWFNPYLAGIGTHTHFLYYSDPLGCENFATETILVDPCTGISEKDSDSEILIYPNPGKGLFTIRLNRNDSKLNLELFQCHERKGI